MASPIENARKRLAALRGEAAEIERFIAMYEQFSDGEAADAMSVQPNSQETYPQELRAVDNGDNSQRRERSGPLPRELVAMMARVIHEVGRPMTRGEIVEALERREIEIPAKDKQRYIGTLAWRNKGAFVNIEGRGYWLRGLPVVSDQDISGAFTDPPEEHSEELFPSDM